MDRAIHRDARAGVARCVPARRSRRHEGARRCERTAGARSGRGVASLASVRSDASLEIFAKGMNMRIYDLYESPHGQILLAANDAGIAGVYFSGQKYFPKDETQWG